MKYLIMLKALSNIQAYRVNLRIYEQIGYRNVVRSGRGADYNAMKR